MLPDDSMVVIPNSTPDQDEVRPAVDHHHRRQRNVTRLMGGLRRSSIPPNHHQTALVEVPENVEPSSMARVKKKIKHKRMWDDEPVAQASEVLNTTSKRPNRIKTRRRLIPSSSTARALRTAAVVLQEDPYYDFGKKIKHTSSSPASSSSTSTLAAGFNVLDLETRTSVKYPVVINTTGEDGFKAVEIDQDKSAERNNGVRTRAGQQANSRNHTAANRRPDNLAECVYPRFVRRNKSRSQRDVRCLPPEPPVDARTTRILSTVVTSVSSVKGTQNKKNDTTEAEPSPAVAVADGNATDGYRPTTVPSETPSSSTSANNHQQPPVSTGYPKYLRNRYRNISLPEYLEITKVNQKRLMTGNTATTPTAVTTVRSVSPSTEVTSPTAMTTSPSSPAYLSPVDVTAETTDVLTTGDPPSTDIPSPPTDLQDFIYLNNGTSETPPSDTTSNGAVEARQRRPPSLPRNITRQQVPIEHDVGVVYPEGLATSTYLLTFLAIVPLIVAIVFAFKLAVRRRKKKVFDSSEYSSEYNRSPLDFNTMTSSPITTKLPRVPQHIVWDTEKTTASAGTAVVPLPNNSRWEFPRDKLRLQTILGQGNFGQVWKAEADDISGHEGLTRLVAVKMVKEDAASREREDLIRELSIMQHLGSHPNVVTLLGCCTEKGTGAHAFI